MIMAQFALTTNLRIKKKDSFQNENADLKNFSDHSL